MFQATIDFETMVHRLKKWDDVKISGLENQWGQFKHQIELFLKGQDVKLSTFCFDAGDDARVLSMLVKHLCCNHTVTTTGAKAGTTKKKIVSKTSGQQAVSIFLTTGDVSCNSFLSNRQ